jgi:hypothetical protein
VTHWQAARRRHGPTRSHELTRSRQTVTATVADARLVTAWPAGHRDPGPAVTVRPGLASGHGHRGFRVRALARASRLSIHSPSRRGTTECAGNTLVAWPHCHSEVTLTRAPSPSCGLRRATVPARQAARPRGVRAGRRAGRHGRRPGRRPAASHGEPTVTVTVTVTVRWQAASLRPPVSGPAAGFRTPAVAGAAAGRGSRPGRRVLDSNSESSDSGSLAG